MRWISSSCLLNLVVNPTNAMFSLVGCSNPDVVKSWLGETAAAQPRRNADVRAWTTAIEPLSVLRVSHAGFRKLKGYYWGSLTGDSILFGGIEGALFVEKPM